MVLRLNRFHHPFSSALMAVKEMEEEIVCNRETDLTGGGAHERETKR
jgi:hypothetical protein